MRAVLSGSPDSGYGLAVRTSHCSSERPGSVTLALVGLKPVFKPLQAPVHIATCMPTDTHVNKKNKNAIGQG